MLEAIKSLEWQILLPYIINLLVAMPCITLHELAHGAMAFRLGDRTARDRGRLTLNPLKHVDPLGLILMVTLGFGWAKPVPVDMRNFRNPKAGMALTALAGPVTNFLLTVVVLALSGILWRGGWPLESAVGSYVFLILLLIAVRSTMLGLFNLIPIPPLDGSKALFSLLPDRAYYTVLRYERYCMLLVFALCYVGAVNSAIFSACGWVLEKLSIAAFFPRELLGLVI